MCGQQAPRNPSSPRLLQFYLFSCSFFPAHSDHRNGVAQVQSCFATWNVTFESILFIYNIHIDAFVHHIFAYNTKQISFHFPGSKVFVWSGISILFHPSCGSGFGSHTTYMHQLLELSDCACDAFYFKLITFVSQITFYIIAGLCKWKKIDDTPADNMAIY